MMQRLVGMLSLLVVWAFACAGAAAAASPAPVITGSLPGKRVPLSDAARRAGVRELHEIHSVGSGSWRVPLFVGVGRKGALCVGSSGFVRCYPPEARLPAYAVAVFGGSGDQPEWGTVVGLVSTRNSRVHVKLQDGTEQTPKLKRWPGFAWAAFASPVSGPESLPNSVTLFDSHGGASGFNNLGWFYTPNGCDNAPATCGRSWRNAGDAFDPYPTPLTERGLAIAANDPLVRRLVGSSDYTVLASGWGRPCDGRGFGAHLQLQLFHPITVDADLPFIDYREGITARYLEGAIHFKVTAVESLHVFVDVLRGRVVGLDVEGDQTKYLQHRIVKAFRPGPDDGC
jgi:hypothetical protein